MGARKRARSAFSEFLNAGRDGSTTSNVAAFVRDQVVPLRPDLVIFYEGANGFYWGSVVENSASPKELPRPQYEDSAGWVAKAARMSSLFARGLQALDQAGIVSGTWGSRESRNTK